MSLSTWLSRTFSHSQAAAAAPNPATTSSNRRHTFRPSLEGLEIRLTLSLTTLASFGAHRTVHGPVGGVIMDSSGNLYGTTAGGGANRDGTVFELAQGSGTITTLASFNGTNGATPQAGLIMDSSGNLYGTTRVWRRLTATARFSSWPRAAARSPRWLRSTAPTVRTRMAGLIMDSSGNLYGTTSMEAPSNARHGFRAGQGQRHDHHAGFVQRHQRRNTRMAA